MQQTAADKNRLETTLKTQEKTIDYAKAQIDEGELMTAKSILDLSYKKLELIKEAEECPQLEQWRLVLLQKVEGHYSQIREIRRSKSKKDACERSSVAQTQ